MKVTSLNTPSRNYAMTCFSSLVLMMMSSQANAACSRDDITFYLDKGFTTDQITTLCSEAPAPASDASQPESKSDSKSQSKNAEQQTTSTAVDDNALFLSRAIKAQKINVSSGSLRYTQKTCIEYGEEDLFGFTPKVCPDVTFTIGLKGLEVLDTGKKYGFYGTPEVRVRSSAIQREIIGGLKDKKPEERELILEKFEKGDETTISIRDDFSLEQVKQVLLKLSN